MKKVMIFFILLLLMTFGILSCQYNNEEELYPNTDCETENISFSGQILPLIQTECAISGCHVSGTGRVAFSDYNAIKGVVDDGRLIQQAIINKNMPPTRPLSNCQIDKLKAWIDQGALNN